MENSKKTLDVTLSDNEYWINCHEDQVSLRYMAKDPFNGDLFLLFLRNDSYHLYKGRIETGLWSTQIKKITAYKHGTSILFEQHGMRASISDPAFPRRKPIFFEAEGKMRELDRVRCRLISV